MSGQHRLLERDRARDRGQAVLGAVLWIAVTAAVVVGLGRVALAAVDDARAATVADAAALAGAAAGDDAAHDAAALNDGSIVRLVRSGDEVQVWVRVGDATAVARAERFRVDLSG